MTTVAELIASDKAMLNSQEVGRVLGMHPQTINLMAKDGTLPFPYIRSGNRTKIPRLELLRFLGAGEEVSTNGSDV